MCGPHTPFDVNDKTCAACIFAVKQTAPGSTTCPCDTYSFARDDSVVAADRSHLRPHTVDAARLCAPITCQTQQRSSWCRRVGVKGS